MTPRMGVCFPSSFRGVKVLVIIDYSSVVIIMRGVGGGGRVGEVY